MVFKENISFICAQSLQLKLREKRKCKKREKY